MAPPRYVRGCWDQNVGRERCQGYAQQQEGRGRGVRPVPGAVRAGGGGLEAPGHAASSTTYGSRTVTHWHYQVTPEEPHPIHLTATSRVLTSLTSTVGFRGWVAVCGSGNEMDSPLRELRVDPGRELHEVEDLHLLGREFGVEGLHEDAVVVKLVAADGAEDLQDPFGRRGGAVPELGVEPDLGEVGPLHAGADLAFDPGWIVEQHRGGVLDALEQVVSAFEVRLVAVGRQHLRVAQETVVADQGEAAVAGRVGADLVQLDVVGDREPGGTDLAVAGLGSGSAGAASDGCFPLISNDRLLSDAQVLAAYRYQPNLERRHHLLKSVQDAAPVLLHNPARIEALFCCQFLALGGDVWLHCALLISNLRCLHRDPFQQHEPE